MPYTITELNQISQDAFVGALGAIFTHNPEIAAQTWHQRPFRDVADLHQKMVQVAYKMSPEGQMALLCTQPNLDKKVKMDDVSNQEQSEFALDNLTPEEYEHFHGLIQLYRDRFGFPFIVVLKNHTKDSLLEVFEHRLNHSLDAEKEQAFQEITEIARLRLKSLILD